MAIEIAHLFTVAELNEAHDHFSESLLGLVRGFTGAEDTVPGS